MSVITSTVPSLGVVSQVEDEAVLQNEDHRVIETEEFLLAIDRIGSDLEQAGYSAPKLVIQSCVIGAVRIIF